MLFLRSNATLAAALFVGAMTSACTQEFNTDVALDPPDGARSAALAIMKGNELEVHTFDIDAPPATLPAYSGFDEGTPFEISARYYADTLATLGMPSGLIPERTGDGDDDFGPLPESSIPDQIRVVLDAEDSGWRPGSFSERLQKFVSPVLPVDRLACFDLVSVINVALSTYEVVDQLAGNERGEVLAAAKRGQFAREPIYFVREEDEVWAARRLDSGSDADPTLEPLLGDQVVRALASDSSGDFVIAACRGQDTSVIAGHPDTGFSIVSSSTTTGCAGFVPVLLTFELNGVEHLWLQVLDRLERYEKTRGRWQLGSVIESPRLAIMAGSPEHEVYGVDSESRRVVYRLEPDDTWSQESVPFAVPWVPRDLPPSEQIAGLIAKADSTRIATASNDLIGVGNRFYERIGGTWRLYESNGEQKLRAIQPLYEGLVFSGVSGVFAQVTPNGTCENRDPVSTGLWFGEHLVRLDARRFAVGGLKDSRAADDVRGARPEHGPNHIAIMKARPAPP